MRSNHAIVAGQFHWSNLVAGYWGNGCFGLLSIWLAVVARLTSSVKNSRTIREAVRRIRGRSWSRASSWNWEVNIIYKIEHQLHIFATLKAKFFLFILIKCLNLLSQLRYCSMGGPSRISQFGYPYWWHYSCWGRALRCIGGEANIGRAEYNLCSESCGVKEHCQGEIPCCSFRI